MRVHLLRLIVGVSVAASVLTVATVVSHAAQLGNFNVGPRAPTMSAAPAMRDPGVMRAPSSPNFGGGAGLRTEPRLQRLKDHYDTTDVGDDSRGKGKGDGRRRPKRPIHVEPIIGTTTTTVIGIGAAAGSGGPASAAGGGTPPGGANPARIYIPPADEDRFVKDEVMLEFAGNYQRPGIIQALRGRGLTLLETQFFTLTNSTIVRAHIDDGRPVRVALRSLIGVTAIRNAQPNMLFVGSQDEAAKVTPVVATAAAIPAGGDPAQYALTKLHLGEAHTLANGDRVLVAVIDSRIDMNHPDLIGAFAGSYDATGKTAPPHQHGTAVAGAIAAHARLMGAAPAAKILAIQAFGGVSADATTMAILKGVEYASVQHARIINMSFAGPNDPGLAREIAVAKTNGAVLIAASGNFGPKSPPQYPAADPNVIAVSATDADDHLFKASNIGPHIAVAAPGVDILLPSPGSDYRLISGTSFSAAYVSGVVALVLQRAPELTPDAVRKVLQDTAKDLGAPGKDPEYGAGLVDAYQAIMAVQPPVASAVPVVVPLTSTGAEQAKAQ